MAEKFIKNAIKNPGGLHRALHVPQDQKIPAAKIEAATHSDNPRVRKMANFAQTLKSFHHPALKQAASAHKKYHGA